MKFRFQKLGSIFVCIFYNLFFSFVSLEAITIEVFIPLCDGKSLVCGKGKAGDPRSLEENLYWGAAFGAETFFKRNSNFKILEIKERKSDSPILRTLIIEKKRKQNETYTKLIIYAYAGDKIDKRAFRLFKRFLRKISCRYYRLVRSQSVNGSYFTKATISIR